MRRRIPVVLAVVCAVGMACAAVRFTPRPPPVHADEAVDDPGPDPAVRHALVRAAARDVVARELVAGRMALPEAAARFGWLNALPPAARTRPSEHLAALAGLPADEKYEEGEALALQVVAWLRRSGMGDESVRAQESALRQFREARAEGRLTQLPEVAESERARLLAQAEAEANAAAGSVAPRRRDADQ